MRQLLLIILIGVKSLAFCQEPIVVTMERVGATGEGKIIHRLHIPRNSWADTYPSANHSHLGIDSVVGLYNFIHYRQTIFQAVKRGAMAEHYLTNQINKWGLDTTKLTSQTIRSYISAVMGRVQGRNCIVLDTDGDGQLQDEQIFFEDQGLGLHTIHFECYRMGQIIPDSVLINISQIDYPNKTVSYYYAESRAGTVALGGVEYHVELNALLNDYRFDEHERVVFSNREGNKLGTFSFGDVISLPDARYRIAHIDDDGDKLALKPYTRDTVFSIQVGGFAPVFAGQSLQGDTVSLQQYSGHHTILYFWNTTCASSNQFLKEHLGRYVAKKGEVKLLSVALDDSVNFGDVQGIFDPASLIIQPANGDINQIYRVAVYPTMYLIDPQGRILLKKDLGLNISTIFKEIEDLLYPD